MEREFRYDKPEGLEHDTFVGKAFRKTKEIFRDTPIELLLLGITGAAFAAVMSYSHEVARSHKMPLAFSEISQLESEALEYETGFGAMTEYYAKLNDVVMKTLEACNISWANGEKDNTNTFAHELGKRMRKDSEYGLKFHYTINDLLEAIPNLAENANEIMSRFSRNQALIRSLNEELDATWTESHFDHYRTETYWDTESYTDSNGNSHSRQVMRTRIVYDHTTHSYRFHADHAANADRLLKDLESAIGHLNWPEELVRAKKVNAPNQDAVVVSRTKGEKVPELSDAEILDLVNSWNTGSTYNVNKPKIMNVVNNIPDYPEKFAAANETSRSTSYNTYSHSDSGPKEYQTVNEIMKSGREMDSGITEIVNGINQAYLGAPQLKKTIEEFVQLRGNPDDLNAEIMMTVKSWYQSNMKGGLDVDMFRLHCIFLWGLFGAVAGGLTGLGLDKLGTRYSWYEDRRSDNMRSF